MGGCAAVCFLSCVNCCAKEIGTACVGMLGREKVTKLFYIVLDLLIVVPAVFIFYYLQNWKTFVEYFSDWINCPQESGGQLNCLGISAVYRLSFSLLLLYLLMALVMVCRNRCSKVVNQGLFFIKYLCVVGAFIGFLWVTNDIFLGYGTACKYIGLVFLVLQSIILIDLFYLWGIKWIKKYDDNSGGCYATLLISFTIIMYAGALAGNVYGYIKFKDCTLWVNIVTSILLVLIPGIQFLHFNVQNSLLTTSVVCMYVSYLGLISQYSREECSALNTGAMWGDVLTSAFLFFLTMYGSVMGGSGVVKINQQLGISTPADQNTTQADGQQVPLQAPAIQQRKIATQAEEEIELNRTYQGWGWLKWHIYMAIGSMYIAMMITNWGSPQLNTGIFDSYTPNGFAFWSRVGLQWATSLLYIWTLVAPRIFPDRDFVIE